SSGEAPPSSRSRMRGPRNGFTQACVATAPTRGRTNGQMLPAASALDETATPSMPVTASRAAIEKVDRRFVAAKVDRRFVVVKVDRRFMAVPVYRAEWG